MNAELDIKWEAPEPGVLTLVGTKLFIIHAPGAHPFHVHRRVETPRCYGSFETLDEAKARAVETVSALLEMGLDP